MGVARTAGAVLTVLGWTILILGGLFALVVAFYSVVGYGDAQPHLAAEDVQIPAAILALGAVLAFAGRSLRRGSRPPPSCGPPPR